MFDQQWLKTTVCSIEFPLDFRKGQTEFWQIIAGVKNGSFLSRGCWSTGTEERGGAVSTGDSVVEDTSLASLETSHSQSDFSYTQFVCPKELLSAPIGALYIRMFNSQLFRREI